MLQFFYILAAAFLGGSLGVFASAVWAYKQARK
jgi:hypothetical protein